jgi:hypothetical protein
MTPTTASICSVHVQLSISFFARRDDFDAAQPEGRKIVAQCASTGRKTVPPQPRTGRKNRRGGPFLRPVPGLANAPACYPRRRAVGHYLSPFGLCALSRLRLSDMCYIARNTFSFSATMLKVGPSTTPG